MRHSNHAVSQIGRRFVKLIEFLEIGDLTSNDGLIHTFCAVAFKNVGAGTAVPLSADEFDHFVRFDVKLPRQLVWQIKPVFLASRLFERVEDFVGYNLFHTCVSGGSNRWRLPAFATRVNRLKDCGRVRPLKDVWIYDPE